MALTDNGNGMYMPVAPAYGGYNNGFGGFGGDGWWIILLLLACNGGWGGFGGGYGNMALGYDFPWILNGQNGINSNTNSGFRDSMINDGINSISDKVASGFGDVQTALCGGFAGVNASIANANTANLERSFGVQTAITNGINAVQGQLAQCCCDNRAATADVKYTIATEACATRAANTANTQTILDKLCQLELDAKNDTIAQLRQELVFAKGQASQVAQTADLKAAAAQTANLAIGEMRSCPIPSMPVYGSQPIFSCGNGTGCGCAA